MTAPRSMTLDDHAAAAREFLIHSDEQFQIGDRKQGSEKLWGAASQAVISIAKRRDWSYRTHRALKYAVQRLTNESGDDNLHAGFLAAEKFHKNFYHDEMEDFEIEIDRPIVHRFVETMLNGVSEAND